MSSERVVNNIKGEINSGCPKNGNCGPFRYVYPHIQLIDLGR